MRHRVAGYKLKRDGAARKSLLRGLVTNVIEQERVITTVPKAKAVKPLVDRMITLGKADTLHARREAARVLFTPASVKKLFDTLATRFGQRKGGGAEQAMIELVGSELVKRAAGRAKRKEARERAAREGREPEEEK